MATDSLHPHVVFAQKFGDPSSGHLNAFNALARAEMLVREAGQIKSLLASIAFESDHWMLDGGADIVAYYAVGFVTCLEWHARSRMADLATYAPSALQPSDLKGQVSDRVMLQLLTQRASVAHLLSAGTKVGTLAKYQELLSRVLISFGAPDEAYNLHKATDPNTGELWLTRDDIKELEDLFSFRHQLVHEIGAEVEAQLWTAEKAVSCGTLVLRLMQAFEIAITAYAPKGFPNLLDQTFFPIGRVDYLNAEIAKLEDQILQIIEGKSSSGNDATRDDWLRTLEASRAHRTLESRFIESASILYAQDMDLIGPLQEQLAQARHDFLQMLIKHSQLSWDLPDALEDPSEF